MNTENKIYNPAAQPKQWLIEHFVVRTKVFDKLFKDIQTGKMKYPEQHYLIQGQRGMGKTTLLLRLKYEIENTPELNKWLVPVFFNEESYDLTSLSNLWEKLLKYLDDLWQTGGTYYKKTDDFLGKPDYEKKCFDYLLQILKENEKKLILFFDNFGQLFLDNLKDKEQHRLREILMNCAELRIIGASAIVLKDLHDYSKPFFEFFKIINLEGLNKIETFELIQKLQEKSDAKMDLEKNKAKIETLAILTGGVLRTIMLIYESILADQDGTALKDLEMILDRITPLYKHRIEDLPVQQRRIVDVIAKNWDAISAKDIAGNIREDGQQMATKTISAQLQQLEKNNVIEKKQTNTKNHLYQLRERFFNIWYLMRHGDRHDKCRVVWLTKFLEMWYEDEKGINQFIIEHIKHLRSGKYQPGSAILITEALSNSNKLDINNFELLIKETSTILNSDQKKILQSITREKISKIRKLFEEGRYEDVIEKLKNTQTESVVLRFLLASSYAYTHQNNLANKTINTIKPIDENSNFLLGLFYHQERDFQKSISFLENSLNKHYAQANLLIGECYLSLGKFRDAVEPLKKALVLNKIDVYESLIDAFVILENINEAEKYCLEAISRGFTEFNKELADIYITDYEDISHQKKAKLLIDNGLIANPNDGDYNHLMGTYEYFNGTIQNALFYLKKAHNIYQKNKLQNSFSSLNNSLLLDILVEDIKNKTEAIQILKSLDFLLLKTELLIYDSFIKIWNSEYDLGLDHLRQFLKGINKKDSKNYQDRILNKTFLLLLSRKQFHSVLNIFETKEFNLKNKLNPIYYALMHYLKDEYPNEILKMGEELKQPVEDIMKRVEEMAIEYK